MTVGAKATKLSRIINSNNCLNPDQVTDVLSASTLVYRELEPRIVFDGAIVATSVEAINIDNPDDTETGDNSQQISSPSIQSDTDELVDALMAYSGEGDTSTEIVFIDGAIENLDQLISSIDPAFEIILLQSDIDGVEQIADTLSNRTGIDAIHIISHGNQAELILGTAVLGIDSMNNAYSNELVTISNSFSSNADILIYGCNFGEGALGQQAALRLAELTGADVAASIDETGNANLGGNWDLEYVTGTLESQVVINSDTQENWLGLLVAPSAQDDTAVTNVNTAVNIDLVGNDIDADSPTISVLDVTDPSNGTVVNNDDGTVTYTPGLNYSGNDSFTYLAADLEDTIGYWRLDGDGVDSVGSNDGIVTGTTTVAGVYGDALNFDEFDDKVVIPDFAFNNDFSVSFKFRIDDNSGSLFQYIYSHGDAQFTNSMNVLLVEESNPLDPNKIRTVVRDANDTLDEFALDFDVSGIIGDGQWHTYTLTVEAGTGVIVYLDGVVQNTDTTRGGDSFDPNTNIYLGTREDLASDRFYGGQLDSVQVFDKSLSAAEVDDVHTGGSSVATVDVLVNNPPTGLPTITGTVTEDQTLTANTSGISDADGLGTFSYQWLRNGIAIGGATASTYTLGDADVGTLISVEASYTDSNGTPETVISAQTSAVVNVNDNPVGLPNITGTVTEDQVLTADTSGISDGDGLGAFSYQWLRDGVAIGGAIASTYTLGDNDVGTLVSVEVNYTDGNGKSEGPLTSAQTAAVVNVNDAPAGIPTISGTVTEDQTLTVNTGAISDADGLGIFSYQWLRNGVAIGGATASTYTLGDADVGTLISVEASYTDGHGTSETATSIQTAAVVNINDAPTTTIDNAILYYAAGLGQLSIDPVLAISDVDSATLTSATISIGFGFLPAEDRLAFTNQLGITGSYNSLTGVLSLTGVASVADYQTALQSVTYEDINFTPTQGSLQVDFTVNDGITDSIVDSRSIEIVYDAPPIANLDTGSVNEGNSVVINVSANDIDDDGLLDLNSIVIISPPANGSLIVNGDGTVTYSHDGSETIADSFTYTIEDVGNNVSNTGTVNITINPVNDNPVNTVPVTQSTLEDTTLIFSTANGNLVSVADLDAGGNVIKMTLRVLDNATLAFTGTSGISLSAWTISPGTMNYELQGTVAQINMELDGMVFSPENNFTGSTTLRISTEDLGNTGGGNLTDVDLITINVGAVNDNPVGLPMITGTATEDQTLTANTSGISDVDGLGAFSYQWLRNGVVIGGATASTYTLGDNDVGTLISVEVSFTDGNGTLETVTSTQTAAVVNVNDTPAGLPVVTGTVTEDQTLTADTSGISDGDVLGAFSYQWLRDGVAIGGATALTYTLGDADIGALISVEVSYTDGQGTSEGPLTSTQTAAVANSNDAPVGQPTISGTVIEDQTLTVNTGAISDVDGLGAFSYQWLRNGVAIGGATASTYTLGDADVGTLISVEASYTDGYGTPETVTSAQTAAVVNVNDNPIGLPAITGTVSEDQTLTADTSGISDADGLGAFSYQWLRNGVAIGGATASTYTLGDNDVGTLISVEVSYTDGNGTSEGPLTSAQTAAIVNINDNPIGLPAITGTVSEDQTLTADTSGISDADGLGAFSYQWLRNGVAIGGATASTYTLGDNDVGTLISVEASYTDGNSTPETVTSAQTAPVANVNDNPVGLPAITGTVSEDQTLTADTSGISDTDGLGAFSYQWLRNGVAIGGATASTYTLGDNDVGTLISVEVSYTDGNGTSEGPLTSVQTAAVVNINDNPIGIPTITGTGTEDQILTADTSSISDADGLGTFSYQWLRNGVAIGGATASTHTLGDNDVGTLISVEISYVDVNGTSEGPLTSLQTTPVVNINDAPVITSNGGGASVTINIDENISDVTSVTSSDVDGGTPAYSITGGPEAGLFSIDPVTGVLSFNVAPDFEFPTDGGGINQYDLIVQVSDGNGGTDTQAIRVIVLDVDESAPPATDVSDSPFVDPPDPVDSEVDTGASLAINPVIGNSNIDALDSSNTAPAKADKQPVTNEQQPPEPEKVVTPDIVTELPEEIKIKPIDLAKFENKVELKKFDHKLLIAFDKTQTEMQEHGNVFGLDAKVVTFSTGTLLTAGYVSWILRSGALLSALLSTIPAWSSFDPIVVMTSRRSDDEDGELKENKLSKVERVFEKAAQTKNSPVAQT